MLCKFAAGNRGDEGLVRGEKGEERAAGQGGEGRGRGRGTAGGGQRREVEEEKEELAEDLRAWAREKPKEVVRYWTMKRSGMDFSGGLVGGFMERLDLGMAEEGMAEEVG
ncbi:uncharacterized protein A4U43_C03F28980 [Asparagus officinalis]|uniref:Uncharacterized protein n=1 Tax=Asparagus officinalis TaxID=4686 RepID=A0A5P1FDP8_ASPOF|nr:uncharacterized protein A4U43_C03F28980 [Asparagus officinalis]